MSDLADSDQCTKPSSKLWNFVPLVALLGVVAILGWWTHGLKAFTSYSATLIEAGPLPRQAPPLRYIIPETGEIRDATLTQPAFRRVQFFYANCPAACPLAMGRMHGIKLALGVLMPTQVEILSLSFDHDSPEALHEMWVSHGRQADWNLASLVDAQPDELLRQLGVLVIRRDDGLINHSLDLYLLDSRGQVRAVFSPDDPPELVASTVTGLI